MVDTKTVDAIRERLANFETMTWMEILVKGRKLNHPIPTVALSKAARNRLEVLGLGQVAEVISL